MTDDTVTAKLAEWEALVEGLTPGEWTAEAEPDALHPDATEFWWVAADTMPLGTEADAEFIAAARTAMPALLAAVQDVLTLIDEDHCPGGCEHDAIDAEVLGDRIKRALMEQIGGEG